MMELSEALVQLYPDADPLCDYTLIDQGRGAYIAAWYLDAPRPTAAELAALGVVEGEPVGRENDYITEARAANRAIWNGINALKALQPEWNALNYGETLDEGTGENAGIAGADVGAVVFDTADALAQLLASGHATSMAKLL
jgi:hypothetical protein